MKQDFSETAPLSIFELPKEQLYAELQKGMDDIAAGRVLPADEVIDDILLSLATERMSHYNPILTISQDEVDKELGLSEDALSDLTDVEFE